jgi:hypothetical protein
LNLTSFARFVAYAHGKQEGVLHEKTFNLDYNIQDKDKMFTMGGSMDPHTFVEREWQLIQEKSSAFNDDKRTLASAMKELGMQR